MQSPPDVSNTSDASVNSNNRQSANGLANNTVIPLFDWTQGLKEITIYFSKNSGKLRQRDLSGRMREKLKEALDQLKNDRLHNTMKCSEAKTKYRCFTCGVIAKDIVYCKPISEQQDPSIPIPPRHRYCFECAVDTSRITQDEQTYVFCAQGGHGSRDHKIGVLRDDFDLKEKEFYERIVNADFECENCQTMVEMEDVSSHRCATTRQSSTSDNNEELEKLKNQIIVINGEFMTIQQEIRAKDIELIESKQKVIKYEKRLEQMEDRLKMLEPMEVENQRLKRLNEKLENEKQELNEAQMRREEDHLQELNSLAGIQETARKRERYGLDNGDVRMYSNPMDLKAERRSQNTYEIYSEHFPGGRRTSTNYTDSVFIEGLHSFIKPSGGTGKNIDIKDRDALKDFALISVEHRVIDLDKDGRNQIKVWAKRPSWAFNLVHKSQIPKTPMKLEFRFIGTAEIKNTDRVYTDVERPLLREVNRIYDHYLSLTTQGREAMRQKVSELFSEELAKTLDEVENKDKLKEKDEAKDENEVQFIGIASGSGLKNPKLKTEVKKPEIQMIGIPPLAEMISEVRRRTTARDMFLGETNGDPRETATIPVKSKNRMTSTNVGKSLKFKTRITDESDKDTENGREDDPLKQMPLALTPQGIPKGRGQPLSDKRGNDPSPRKENGSKRPKNSTESNDKTAGTDKGQQDRDETEKCDDDQPMDDVHGDANA